LVSSILKFFRTIRYVKAKQIYYLLKYRLLRSKPKYLDNTPDPKHLVINNFIRSSREIDSVHFNKESLTFNLLNKKKKFFKDQIDWNFDQFGKLWSYQLSYFDFLHSESLSLENKLFLIDSYCDHINSISSGNEPYPISLRSSNWIIFLSRNKILRTKYSRVLFSQLKWLKTHLEFHLMANHLLENLTALIIGGIYFQDKGMLRTPSKLLLEQLDEQILEDGAFFELSPQYHFDIMSKMLILLSIFKDNRNFELEKLKVKVEEKIVKMLGWLQAICFQGNTIPYFNDSRRFDSDIIQESIMLADQLGLQSYKTDLSDSKIRILETESGITAMFKLSAFTPSYQPGHSHSDLLHFILCYKGSIILDDTGISTYDASDTRMRERSTVSHNTVTIDGKNQAEIWKSFRVGRRPDIKFYKDSRNHVVAEHNGYKNLGVLHKRSLNSSENQLVIEDTLSGNQKGTSHYHFHPEVQPVLRDNMVEANGLIIEITGYEEISIVEYDYAHDFNSIVKSTKLEVSFYNNLKTTICPKEFYI